MRPGAPFLPPLVLAGDSSLLFVFPLPSDPSASMLTSSSSVATAAAKQTGHALLGRQAIAAGSPLSHADSLGCQGPAYNLHCQPLAHKCCPINSRDM